MHEQERRLLVLGVGGDREAETASLRGAAHSLGMQRPADLADDSGLSRVFELVCEDRGVEEHRCLALLERRGSLGLAEALRALRTAGDQLLQRLGRLHAGFVVEDRVPLLVENFAAERIKSEQISVGRVLPGLCADGNAAHVWLELLDPARDIDQLVVVLRNLELMLLEDVGAVCEG